MRLNPKPQSQTPSDCAFPCLEPQGLAWQESELRENPTSGSVHQRKLAICHEGRCNARPVRRGGSGLLELDSTKKYSLYRSDGNPCAGHSLISNDNRENPFLTHPPLFSRDKQPQRFQDAKAATMRIMHMIRERSLNRMAILKRIITRPFRKKMYSILIDTTNGCNLRCVFWRKDQGQGSREPCFGRCGAKSA